MHVNDLLKIAVEKGASDLHLKVGSYPMVRVHGHLVPIGVHQQRLGLQRTTLDQRARQQAPNLGGPLEQRGKAHPPRRRQRTAA